jgi:hypothetical protein
MRTRRIKTPEFQVFLNLKEEKKIPRNKWR